MSVAPPPQRYVLVGLGGIGGLVLRLLVPFLHSERSATSQVCLVDGDAFEERNRARMVFSRPGKKVEVLAEELAPLYGDRVPMLPYPHYLNEARAHDLIREGDVVFCQPDNHATRRVLERRCQRLSDVALFSAGNDGVEKGLSGTYGNVQIYLRQQGRNLTNPLSTFHPEIAEPKDQVPDELGCAAALADAPQILFTNAAVASAMLSAFYAWRRDELRFEEVYLDILSGRVRPVQRRLVSG